MTSEDEIFLKARLYDDIKRNLRQVGLPDTGPEGFVKIFRECIDELRFARASLENAGFSHQAKRIDNFIQWKNMEMEKKDERPEEG